MFDCQICQVFSKNRVNEERHQQYHSILAKYSLSLNEIRQFNVEDIIELPLLSTRRGIKNLGNTCFMNAAIQCLSKCEDFSKYFLLGNYKNEINNLNPYGDQFIKRFRGIIYQLFEINDIAVNPHDFIKYITKNCSSWGIINLQDCHEFLSFLLNSLHENLNLVSNSQNNDKKEKSQGPNESDKEASERFWKANLQKDNSIIVDLFHGQFKSVVTYVNCKTKKITYEPFIYLGLPIPSFYQNVTFKFVSKDYKVHNYQCKIAKTSTIRELCNVICDSGKAEKQNIEIMSLNSKKYIISSISQGEKVMNYTKHGKDIIFYEKLDNFSYRGNIQIYLIFEEKGKSSHYPVPLIINQANTIEDLFIKIYDVFLTDNRFFNYNSIGGKISKLQKAKQMFRLLYYNNSPTSTNYVDVLKAHSLSEQFELNDLVLFEYIVGVKKHFPIVFIVDIKMKFKNDSFAIENSNRKISETISKNSISIYDCFNSFRTEELLSLENTIHCSTCKTNEQIFKKLDIFKPPLYLIIQIKRFRYQNSSSLFDFSNINQSKNDTLVDFPLDNLDLRDYVVDKEHKAEAIYDLVAVAQHVGQLNAGHYTSICRVTGNKWYKFNDDKVKEVSKKEVVSNEAYILFYKKKDKIEEKTNKRNKFKIINCIKNSNIK